MHLTATFGIFLNKHTFVKAFFFKQPWECSAKLIMPKYPKWAKLISRPTLFVKVKWICKVKLPILSTLIRQHNLSLPTPNLDQSQQISILQSALHISVITPCYYTSERFWVHLILSSIACHFMSLLYFDANHHLRWRELALACATRHPPHSYIPHIHPPRASSHIANVQMRCLVF